MPSTQENLKEAFAGESQASRKYTAFAQRAAQEGYPNIARLFRAAAEAETIHALGHFAALDGIGKTAENLQVAIDGETYEYTQMYPPMVQQAAVEGHKGKRMMEFAAKAEAVHARLYKQALEAAQAGKDLEQGEFYLCPFCGHVEVGPPEGPCPVCGAKPEKYVCM